MTHHSEVMKKEYKDKLRRKSWSRQEVQFDMSGESRVWFRKGQDDYDRGVHENSLFVKALNPLRRGAWLMGFRAAELVQKGYEKAQRGTAYFQTMPHVTNFPTDDLSYE